MEAYRTEIIETVVSPHIVLDDPEFGRKRFHRAGVGPSRWLRVGRRLRTTACADRHCIWDRKGTFKVIHLGPYALDHVVYYADGDVLYMAIDKPRPAFESLETPEGHIVRYDENHEVIGVTIVSAKRWLDKAGEIRVTFPETPAVADTREVEAALAA
jgi:uncharacterized protein YuzE